jgi:hypothetical protein
MKRIICTLGLLISFSAFSFYNNCWALHDDDNITRGGAWSDENTSPTPSKSDDDSSNLDKFFKKTPIVIPPYNSDENKEPASKDSDNDDTKVYIAPGNNEENSK